MDFVAALPVWALFLLILALRVADVTLGTLRTVSIVKGYMGLSMALGFFEVGIWVVAIAQVINRLHESWWLVVAYAGGFALGNGVGILAERRIALGAAVVRLISAGNGGRIATALRRQGRTVTTFAGEGRDGPVTLVYVVGPRRDVPAVLAAARAVDPKLFHVIEPAHETNLGVRERLRPVPLPTGWRAVAKKK